MTGLFGAVVAGVSVNAAPLEIVCLRGRGAASELKSMLPPLSSDMVDISRFGVEIWLKIALRATAEC